MGISELKVNMKVCYIRVCMLFTTSYLVIQLMFVFLSQLSSSCIKDKVHRTLETSWIKRSKENKTICRGFNTQNITMCQMFYGRLGNNMFVYASNFCFAKKYGFHPLIPDFLPIYKIFKISQEAMDFYKIKRLCLGSDRHRGTFHGKFIPEKFNISCKKPFRMDGLLQSYHNFRDCENDIRKEFEFRKDLKSKTENLLKGTMRENFKFDLKQFVMVAIHVRRGDYVKSVYPVATKSFYDKARDIFRKKYSRVKFIVLTYPNTEARIWCMMNLVNGNNDTFLVPDERKEIHLYMLAHSDHCIISAGTFGWWGAWLNKNATVVKWNVLYDSMYWKPADFYPPHWLTIHEPGFGKIVKSKKFLSL